MKIRLRNPIKGLQSPIKITRSYNYGVGVDLVNYGKDSKSRISKIRDELARGLEQAANKLKTTT